MSMKKAKAARAAAKAAARTGGAQTLAAPGASRPAPAETGERPTGEDWTFRPDADAGDPGRDPARPSISEDKRSLDRFSQRELGRVTVSIRVPGGEWRDARLWDFSSIGFGVLLERPPASLHDPILGRGPGRRPAESGFRAGAEAELRIRVRAKEEFTVLCRIQNAYPWRTGVKVGLRRLDVNLPQAGGPDRRETQRLPLSPALSLRARIRHPFIYDHWSVLQVSDVNKSLGFSFLCADPSILLFEGMELDIHFELATLRKLSFTGRVVWVQATRENEVKFGVDCVDMDWRLQTGLCGFLLSTGNWTPSRLRGAGFRSQRVKGHLRFRTVRSMEDYASVLRLRRDAYVSADKRPESTTVEEMASPLDGASRILMARHHGELVGSLTFTFPTSEDTLLDSQAGFPGLKYPVSLPPKANLIEVSRLCIHRDYRGTDLLQGMFEHGLKHFLLSDRHWLLTSATSDLLPMYERIGFTRLKASYRHPGLNNKEHHLIIAHKSAFLWGFGIGPLIWNSVFGDLVGYLLARNALTLPGWTRTIVRAKLLLRPLARALVDAQAKRAFRKHLKALRSRQGAGPGLPGRD